MWRSGTSLRFVPSWKVPRGPHGENQAPRGTRATSLLSPVERLQRLASVITHKQGVEGKFLSMALFTVQKWLAMRSDLAAVASEMEKMTCNHFFYPVFSIRDFLPRCHKYELLSPWTREFGNPSERQRHMAGGQVYPWLCADPLVAQRTCWF